MWRGGKHRPPKCFEPREFSTIMQGHPRSTKCHKFNDIYFNKHLSKGKFINSNPLPESRSRTICSHPSNTIVLILGIFQRLVPYVGSIEWSEKDLGTASLLDSAGVALSTEESFSMVSSPSKMNPRFHEIVFLSSQENDIHPNFTVVPGQPASKSEGVL